MIAGIFLLGIIILLSLNELVRPYLLRWERKCAIRELRYYEKECREADDPRMKLFWAQEVIDCRARHRFRLGELPE
jgi:hypothetical protein